MRYRIKRREAIRKIAVFAFVVSLVLLSLLSEMFVITHAGHEHDHSGTSGGCAVCIQIHHAENLLRQFGMAFIVMAFVVGSGFAAPMIFKPVFSQAGSVSLYGLKTRLNN